MAMSKIMLCCLIVMWATSQVNAQHCCCCKLRTSGQAEYDAKRYTAAIQKWENAKKCSDAGECKDLNDLIARAKRRLNEQSQTTQKSKHKSTLQNKIGSVPRPKMVFVSGGTFEMGDVMEVHGADDEYPIHEVTVRDYYLGVYEVSFEEYDLFCVATKRKKPHDEGWGRGKRPVVNVSWYNAVEYCNWLSQQTKLKPVYTINKNTKDPNNTSDNDDFKWIVSVDWSANGYRLPTEAEWEYAARAVNGKGGGKVRFGNGKDIADPKNMNFNGSKDKKRPYPYSIVGEYRRKTTPVGSFSPNSLGLYDMSGNVWEWCWDWYGAYPKDSQADPKGAVSGSDRVLRGGSLDSKPEFVYCTNRLMYIPVNRSYDLGFRLARAAR